ncbi:MAG: hypothetical protein E6X34_03900 [Clostridium sp.]|nr:hypothetical protein [Clostridium sp.]MDU4937584.1 hypothetical protein [Clostridium sp.]
MKAKRNMRTMIKKATRKANLLMEIGEDMMDLMMKARRYKRMTKK